ncbi:YceI family protein [Flavobacterium chilense]|uniref:Polyisoprenoid-binding protein YceI n=1 Tax=Flavobacterium chilense TaxID=946677 RepID=A0A1M7MDQ6_9FLAO|nr:YceI family protein [Flavobacterium chilense]SHM88484.1 Polyisoprenoid-binding protein YceI [Flavobacterium chilense]
MKKSFLTIVSLVAISLTAVAQKQVSSKTQIKFFSTTPAEDIEAFNVKSTSTFDPKTGELVFSIPMQSFEFSKSLMQEHYNSKNFLDTKKYPRAKLKGKVNISDIDLKKNDMYEIDVAGELTIKDITNTFYEKAVISVVNGKVAISSKFNIKLEDYGIVFLKGKPSTNISKSVAITVQSEYINN